MGDRTEDRFEGLLREAVRSPSLLASEARLDRDRYVIRRLIGSGGMGMVYEATDRQRDTPIVIKTLSHVSGAAIYQLKQEFRVLADLTHPNLVSLYELSCDGDVWFVTMDLVPGETLREYADAQRDWPHLCRVFSELAVGITTLHQAGLLHRDLKPSNVMVTPQGRVVILDFGLACRHAGGANGEAPENSLSGTPWYMAPEQASGDTVTQASDWYAFGTMLYEILAGHLPFEGNGKAVLAAKRMQPAPALGEVLPGTPTEVVRLCGSLLDRDPLRRAGHTQVTQVFPLPEAEPVCQGPPGSAVFVGREAELEILGDALETTSHDRPVALLIQGSSGVGKTALVQHFLEGLGGLGQTVVLRGRCYEHESVPYKACDSLVDALSSHLIQLPQEKLLHMLPRQAHALARIFPVFDRPEILGSLPRRLPLPPDPRELRSRGQRALKDLLGRLAERQPVVLHLDDAQWSDVDGARLLTGLLAPPDPPPLLLICAFRSEALPARHGLRALLEGLRNQECVDLRELTLSDLDDSDSLELAERLLHPSLASWAAQIAAESKGSPFVITRSAQWVEDTQPSGPVAPSHANIDAMLHAHVAALPRPDQDLLEAVCVAGRVLDHALLRRVTRHTDDAPALRRLRASLLLRLANEAGDALDVYHDRIREAVLTGLSSERITHWHRRFAEALRHATGSESRALTHHLLGAGEWALAADAALSAAEEAVAALAFDQAADLYDVALEHGRWDTEKRVSILVAQGEALVNDLRAADGGRALLEAARLAPTEATRVKLLRRGGALLLMSGDLDGGLEVLGQAFTTLGLDLEDLCAADVDTLMQRLLTRGFAFEPRALETLAPEERGRLEILWDSALGLAHHRYAETYALALRCTLDALDLGAMEYIVRGLMGVAILEATMAPGQQQMLLLMTHLCNQQGDPMARVYLALTEGNIALFQCKPTDMLEASTRALDILGRHTVGRVKEQSIARTLLLSAYFQRGDMAQLWRSATLWLAEAEQKHNDYLSAWAAIYLTIHYLATDEPQRARRSLDQAQTYGQGSAPGVVAVAVSQYRALCDAYEGLPRAWERITETGSLIERSELAGNPLKLSDQAYFRGIIALRLAPNHPEVEALLDAAEESVAMLESLPLPDGRTQTIDYWVPHSLLLRAGLRAARGEETRALALLDEALTSFDAVDSSLSSRACALRRKGQLLRATTDPAGGTALMREAEAELSRLGISEQERFCELFAPGFGAGLAADSPFR